MSPRSRASGFEGNKQHIENVTQTLERLWWICLYQIVTVRSTHIWELALTKMEKRAWRICSVTSNSAADCSISLRYAMWMCYHNTVIGPRRSRNGRNPPIVHSEMGSAPIFQSLHRCRPNSAADCSIFLKFCTEFDHVIADTLLQTFKVNGSKVKATA